MSNDTLRMTDPLTITMTASEWTWLLGVLATLPTESSVIDKFYGQILSRTE
jgi:hypothetical protein